MRVQKQLEVDSLLYQRVRYLLRHNHHDMYIDENDIIKVIDQTNISGNNRKYLELYDKIAPLYRIANTIYFKWKFGGEENYRNEFLSALEIKPYDRILETSVGAGDNFRFIRKDVSLVGVDLSYGMLKQARKNLKKWQRDAYLFQGNAEILPFKNNLFDVVFHVGGINFFNDKEKAIQEMIRVAKSGTKIMIVDETEELIETTYKKTPITNKYYQETDQVTSLLEYIPTDMLDIQYKEICKGLMYCITFRKP